MSRRNRLNLVFLFVAILTIGCGGDTSVDELQQTGHVGSPTLESSHFVAKELHFQLQSGTDRQMVEMVFENLKQQLEKLPEQVAKANNVAPNDVSGITDICESLQQDFDYVLSGASDYEKRFSEVDGKLSRQISGLEELVRQYPSL